MSREIIKRQAELLAGENRKAEPSITRIYWFPDDHEVRLVELISTVPRADDGRVHPFYFRANAEEDLPAPTGIALIRPEEFRQLSLPEKWGGWEAAVSLEVVAEEPAR